jgi:hypothetical protein
MHGSLLTDFLVSLALTGVVCIMTGFVCLAFGGISYLYHKNKSTAGYASQSAIAVEDKYFQENLDMYRRVFFAGAWFVVLGVVIFFGGALIPR